MNKTRLILVGGFLGAGKTTLLYEASKQLIEQGKRIGLVTNDQAPELVDTALLLQSNLTVSELSGSCFCCNYNGFIDSLRQVKKSAHADIIIAEPVGSCTDLSATIVHPLKEHMNTELVVSPLTVLADPVRLIDILDCGTAGLHPSAAYIFRKQIEESDIILITKTDILKSEELTIIKDKVKNQFPNHEILTISAKTGDGVNDWLQKVLNNTVTVGQRIVEVDYERYAEGEAVLGWLNATILLKSKQENWDDFAKEILSELSKEIDSQNVSVGHVKLMLKNGESHIVGNLTGNISTLNFRGSAGIGNEANIILNARIGVSPKALEGLVKTTLEKVTKNRIAIEIKAWKCLSPGYPNPTFRYKK